MKSRPFNSSVDRTSGQQGEGANASLWSRVKAVVRRQLNARSSASTSSAPRQSSASLENQRSGGDFRAGRVGAGLPTPTAAMSREEQLDALDKCWILLKRRLPATSEPGVLIGEFGDMALDLAKVLPTLDGRTARRNAMRWLDAYLTLGQRKPWEAARTKAIAQQAPVWQQLADALPKLKDDCTTQYAILFRLHRTLAREPLPEALEAGAGGAMEAVFQSLGKAQTRECLGPNCTAVFDGVMTAAGSKARAGAPTRASATKPTLSEAIATLPPLTAEQRKRYSAHLDDMIRKLELVRSGRGARHQAMPALIHSLNRHLPGLDAKLFGFATDAANYLPAFAGDGKAVFGILLREDKMHANAVCLEAQLDPADGVRAIQAWMLDTVNWTYEDASAYEMLRLSMACAQGETDPEMRVLLSEVDIQEDGTSCDLMSADFLAKCFRNYDDTRDALRELRNSTPEGARLHPSMRSMRLSFGQDANAKLRAEHAKHIQDKDNDSRLAKWLSSRPELGREIVNKRGQSAQARYHAPRNLRVKNGKTLSTSVERQLGRWVDRALKDLRSIKADPDGGASQWRKACVAMAPWVLEDRRLTDRLVGIDEYPDIKDSMLQRAKLLKERYEAQSDDDAKTRLYWRQMEMERGGEVREEYWLHRQAALDAGRPDPADSDESSSDGVIDSEVEEINTSTWISQ